MTIEDVSFSLEEKDILQELMNIAFGQASASLAEIIDITVVLTVPNIELLRGADLPKYVMKELKAYDMVSVVEQSFSGKFKGYALLNFPVGAEKRLIALFEKKEDAALSSGDMLMLERETLNEISNILIGACVGKLAELLDDMVAYSPPRIVMENFSYEDTSKSFLDPDSLAISIKTVFHFDAQDISGFLFIITSQESIDWLKKALHKFMAQFD